MARSSDINQRIVLTGADEVRRHLDEIAAAGQKAGNQTRAALVAATTGAQTFTAGTRAAATSSGQMRFALQNLSFQVNDVATSLATGGSAMRVFAQQGGQVVQAFQQGGGLGPVLRAAGSAIASFITPTTAAVAGVAALGGGLALFIARAAEAENSAKQFDVILKATGQSGRTTGRALETAAENLHDVGLSASEAREQFRKFISEGGIADQAPKIVRIGADLNKVLGEGSLERFVSAAARGGAPLEEIARQLGIVVPNAAEAAKALDDAAKSAQKFNQSIADAFTSQNRSLADVGRDTARQLEDQRRQLAIQAKGTLTAAQQQANQREEIELQSTRRIEDIHRQTTQTISDLIAQRNQQNTEALKVYNDNITAAAQAAADKQSLIQQIGQRVLGSFQGSLTPIQEAVVAFSVAWNDLNDTIAKSTFIQTIIADVAEMIRSISEAIKWLDKLTQALRAVPGLPTSLGGSGEPVIQSNAAGGLIRGPGTGTSDSIISRLSAGEYVNTAASVQRFGVGFFESLNRMSMPAMPRFRMPSGFAMGGLVTAGAGGGGGTPVHFHLDGGSFALRGDRAVVQAMVRGSRKSSMLSAGRKPSTA